MESNLRVFFRALWDELITFLIRSNTSASKTDRAVLVKSNGSETHGEQEITKRHRVLSIHDGGSLNT